MKEHWAIYGGVKMLRIYCSKCKGITLVTKGIKLCCDSPIEEKSQIIKVMTTSGIMRRRPNKKIQTQILKLQDNKCLYCKMEFNTPYLKNGKVLFTKIHFDHLVPYSYSQTNKCVFVAACNICNGIKYNKMFNTIEEVSNYVRYNREKKGIQYASEENLSPMQKTICSDEEK